MGTEASLEETYLSGRSSDFDSFARAVVEFMDALDVPTEADTKVKVITPFLEELGWSQYSSRFRMEYAPVDGLSHRPDYLLHDASDDPRIAVEAKKWRAKIGSSEVTQMENYLRIYNLHYGILTNGYRFLFFIQPDTDAIEIPDPIRRDIDEIRLGKEFIHQFKPGDGNKQECFIPSSKWLRGTPQHFYEEMLVQDDEHAIPSEILVEVYNKVASENGQETLTDRQFWGEMYDAGIEKQEKTRGRRFTPGSRKDTVLLGYRLSGECVNYLDKEHKEHPCIASMLTTIGHQE